VCFYKLKHVSLFIWSEKQYQIFEITYMTLLFDTYAKYEGSKTEDKKLLPEYKIKSLVKLNYSI
jgi:hypothetical protein